MSFSFRYALRNLWRMKFRTAALLAVLLLLAAAATVGLNAYRSTAAEAKRIRYETPVMVSMTIRDTAGETDAAKITLGAAQTLFASKYVKSVGIHLAGLAVANGTLINHYATVGGLYAPDKIQQAEDVGEFSGRRILSADLFGRPQQLVASTDPSMYPGFTDGRYQLAEGRFPAQFTAKDGFSKDILLSADYAAAFDLQIGDPVYAALPTSILSNVYFFEFTLCGTYSSLDADADIAFIPFNTHMLYLYSYHHNSLLTGYPDYALYDIDQNRYSNFNRVDFLLYRGDEAADFIREASKETVDLGRYELNANDQNYKQLTARLDDVAAITAVFTAVILAAGVAIFMLLIANFTSNRAGEIGVLRALGERPSIILCSLAVALFTIVLLALLLGCLIGTLSGSGLIAYLNEQSVAAQTGAANLDYTLLSSYQADSNTSIIEVSMSVLPEPEVFLVVFAGGLVTAGAALLLCWWTIMRSEPMEILSGGVKV